MLLMVWYLDILRLLGTDSTENNVNFTGSVVFYDRLNDLVGGKQKWNISNQECSKLLALS